MSEATSLYIISGPSGSGKTTTLRALMGQNLQDIELQMMEKITTRVAKPSDNPDEIVSVTHEDYDCAVAERGLVTYERHGHRYALLGSKVAPDGEGQPYIQAAPTKIGQELRLLHPQMRVTVFRLFADEVVLSARLAGRGDKISEAEMASRAKTIAAPAPDGVDYMIDASFAPEIVAKRIGNIIERLEKANRLNLACG